MVTDDDESYQLTPDDPRGSGDGKGTDMLTTDLATLPSGTLLDERALARCLQVSPRTLRRMVVRGELPPGIRLGGRTVWIAGRVLEHLNARAERIARQAEKNAPTKWEEKLR